MKLTVDHKGDTGVTGVSGHPLLLDSVRQTVLMWKFEEVREGEKNRHLELVCDFALGDGTVGEGSPPELIVFDAPGHILIKSVPIMFSDPAGQIGKRPWWQKIGS